MSRIEDIEARLSAATPDYWDCDGFADGDVVNLSLYEGTTQGRVIAADITRYGDADLLRYAPEDIAYLLAELRKQGDLLDEYVAEHGEHTTENQGRGCPACTAAIRVKARLRAGAEQ